MGEAGEEYTAGCSFSLLCQEDGVFVADGELVLVYSDAEEDEYMGHLVSKESSFCWSPSSLPFSDAEDLFRCARHDTVKWILETSACFGFGHRTAYLAVSYLDRFFCLRRCVDRSVMPWATRLLGVACVSLAAKMEECRAPALSEFRADADYDLCCASVRRMELLVLSTLDWRMGDVTPFDYLPCLCARLLRRGHDGGDDHSAKAKAAALIFSTAQAASVLDYRPSTVAAAAVLAATHGGALTKEALESKMTSFSPAFLLEKEDVFACYTSMLKDRTGKRSSCCPSDAIGANDDAASFSAATASNSNKRMRLELPDMGMFLPSCLASAGARR